MFTANGVEMALEDSVCFATFRGPMRTRQIVVPMPPDGTPLAWRITRMDGG